MREVAGQIDSNWGNHCCCCRFGQKWPSNQIKNDSGIFEHPQDCSSLDYERGFWKENAVCTFCSAFLDTWAKGRSSHILPRHNRDGQCRQKFFNKIIIGDETWCFAHDPENKATEFRMGWWDIFLAEETVIPKVLHQDHIDNFFVSQGVVHKEFVPERKRVNAEFYKGVMVCLLMWIHWVCRCAFCSWRYFLLHDNAPAHKAASVFQFLTPKNVTTLYHPPLPYSPDLSPPDYFLFPKLKMKFKGLHFADVAVIQEAVTDELKTVRKVEFSAAFQKLYNRAKAYVCVCIYANGAYFELKKIFVFPICLRFFF